MKKFTSDVVIGLEVHVELSTNTKLFCGCATFGNDNPNSRTCEVCLGHPGGKPVLNKKVLEYALKLCLGLNCKINPKLIFSRKSYFYPDLSKNYQISQYEIPLGINGKLALESGKEIGLTRVHIEEDPASLVHPSGMHESSYVLVDYNRSGDPLCEIVTEPELTSPEEARDFMKQLISVLDYLEIFDVNRCIIKADVNISIKEKNYTRVEIKNITGFKEIERALNYEIKRQKEEEVIMETRTWNAEKGLTISMRKKEEEEEYGYILDPDLVAVEIDKDMLKEIKKNMPELAADKRKRFVKVYKIKEDDAKVLAADKGLAHLFEKVAEKVDPILSSKWLRRELVKVMNKTEKSFSDLEIDETHIQELLSLLDQNKITGVIARDLFEKLMDKPFSPKAYIKEKGIKVVVDSSELEVFCKEAIEANPKAVEDYKKGEEKALNALIGRVMGKTKGQADPNVLKKIMEKLLK